MYPRFLDPAYAEEFMVAGKPVEIPRCRIQFKPWLGQAVKETFGGKPIVFTDDEPMFAEMAVLRHYLNNGWDGRWLVTTGRLGKEPVYLREWKDDKFATQLNEPVDDKLAQQVLTGMAKQNKACYNGCWDLLCWKDDTVVFTRVVRNNKDNISPANNAWLIAGLALGLQPDNFLIAQWDFNPRCA
jgi:hypothetical protein